MAGYATPELCDYFERRCDRFVNGGCTTRRCVERGRAQNPGQAPLMSPGQLSTCEAFEAAHVIAEAIGRTYSADYETAPENRALTRDEIAAEAKALGRLISSSPN